MAYTLCELAALDLSEAYNARRVAKEKAEDAYYDALSELVERCPIGVPHPRTRVD